MGALVVAVGRRGQLHVRHRVVAPRRCVVSGDEEHDAQQCRLEQLRTVAEAVGTVAFLEGPAVDADGNVFFSDIAGNPVESSVTGGVAAYRAHKADGIIGLGGGAALDVAKAIALMATHPGTLFEYEDGRPGARPIDKHLPYWVALPTTSGTGSEVGRSAVISDDKTHVKKIVFSPKLLARAVFADPELTVALPPKVTAATGMDALTHCIEAYLAKDYHPICDGIALEGLRLAARALPRCIELAALLMNQSQVVMRGCIRGVQSSALKVLFESSLRAVLTHDFAEVASQKHKKHNDQKG